MNRDDLLKALNISCITVFGYSVCGNLFLSFDRIDNVDVLTLLDPDIPSLLEQNVPCGELDWVRVLAKYDYLPAIAYLRSLKIENVLK